MAISLVIGFLQFAIACFGLLLAFVVLPNKCELRTLGGGALFVVFSYEDTNPIKSEPHPYDLILPQLPPKDPFSRYSHAEGQSLSIRICREHGSIHAGASRKLEEHGRGHNHLVEGEGAAEGSGVTLVWVWGTWVCAV